MLKGGMNQPGEACIRPVEEGAGRDAACKEEAAVIGAGLMRTLQYHLVPAVN